MATKKTTKLGAAYKAWASEHAVEIEGLLKDAFLAGFHCALERLDEDRTKSREARDGDD